MICERDKEEVREVSIPSDKAYPNYYQCKACNSLFPAIGDTDEWKCPRENESETSINESE